jgi:hypothetical protein
MAVNDLTKKQIEILLNGSQQATYSQRSNVAEYDVSASPTVSTNQKKIWKETARESDGILVHLDPTDMTPNYVGEGNCDVTVTGYCNSQNGNPQWYDVTVDIAGNQFDHVDDLKYSGSSVSVNGVDLSNNSITVSGSSDEAYDGQTAVIQFVAEVWGDVPTGYGVAFENSTQTPQ